MAHPDTESVVLAYLRRFDRGIAPAIGDIVNAVLAEHPQCAASEIRRCVGTLTGSGAVCSRWDNDAHVYWAPHGS